MKHIRKVLIANRGEIALRIQRTCRELGIATVAVYSEADRDAPHVREADEAVLIGPAPASESYLQGVRLIEAALGTGADALHPGYGFLSENAGFAERCIEAGLIFIGPSPTSIRGMGSKSAARQLMVREGVPVVPGYDGSDQSVETLQEEALKIGFPLLIKASAGGGGKGMRIVREPAQLKGSLEAARREAKGAFGDDSLLLERYIDCPRHVEFQILGDMHGTLLHLFERECSIQRRHQKILEETPSPALTPELRARMADAALKAGRAIGYYGAGTVEFILDPEGRFYFLEVNTRLQVEHPVTEAVTGLDLVRLQLQVAEGQKLSLSQAELKQRGHAVEARVYAEDPEHGFLPSTGRLVDWHLPPLPGVRVDSGVETGSEVGIHYDPMLAKIIAWGDNRLESHRRLARALERLSVMGVKTNRDFLLRTIRHPAYLEGALHTHFIQAHLSQEEDAHHPERDAQAMAACVVTLHLERKQRTQAGDGSGPGLTLLPGWRNNRFRDPLVALRIGDAALEVSYRAVTRELFRVMAGFAFMEVRLVQADLPELRLEINGTQRTFRVQRERDILHVWSALGMVSVTVLPDFPEASRVQDPGDTLSPMPGRVLKLRVKPGDTVRRGQPLVTLEAMKMEHTLEAPFDAVVEKVHVQEGQQVNAGEQLLHLCEQNA